MYEMEGPRWSHAAAGSDFSALRTTFNRYRLVGIPANCAPPHSPEANRGFAVSAKRIAVSHISPPAESLRRMVSVLTVKEFLLPTGGRAQGVSANHFKIL